MHLLTLKEKFIVPHILELPPGEYAVEDHNGAQIMNVAGGGIMRPLEETRPFDDTKDWSGKSILLVRAGGFGDVILMTPVMREFKRRWPTCKIGVACMDFYGVVLKHLPFVDEVAGYPIAKEKLMSYDAWVFFEGAIEKNPKAQKLHMTDLFAEIAGLHSAPGLAAAGGHPALDDKKAEYKVTENEMVWLLEQYPRKAGKRRVSIQVGASAACRVYPGNQWQEVIRELLQRGFEVFLLGRKGEIQGSDPVDDLHNLTEVGTTFRQSCAVINSSDLFIGNDSALLHIAGALDIPAVGLYGPFLGSLRTAYAEKTFAIQARGNCAPCFHHANPARPGSAFPDKCPSKEKGICQVLASIEPKQIVLKGEQIAKKFELTAL